MCVSIIFEYGLGIRSLSALLTGRQTKDTGKSQLESSGTIYAVPFGTHGGVTCQDLGPCESEWPISYTHSDSLCECR